MSDYYQYRIKKGVNFPSNVMAVRRGCSGTDIPVVYMHSVHVSIVTYFRPGAQNCNLYDYYMINILNVNVVRSNAAFLRWTCFCLPHLLSYKQSVLQIHCLYYVIDICFQIYRENSLPWIAAFVSSFVDVCPGLVPRDSCAVLSLR